jgi:replicative DNA helicase
MSSGEAHQGQISSGLHALDRITRGLTAGHLVVIGSRPDQGRTSLAITLAGNAAFRQARAVGILSLESSPLAIANRILAAESRVPLRVIASGALSEDQTTMLERTRAKLRRTPLFVHRMRQADVETLADDAKRAWETGRLDLLIVDYVQLLKLFGCGFPDDEKFCAVVRRLKHLARELEIPVVAVSQLAWPRARTSRGPELDDLEGATPLGEHADEVLLINWPERVLGPRDPLATTAEIVVAKNRSGPLGSLHLGFLPELAAFTNLEKVAAA